VEGIAEWAVELEAAAYARGSEGLGDEEQLADVAAPGEA